MTTASCFTTETAGCRISSTVGAISDRLEEHLPRTRSPPTTGPLSRALCTSSSPPPMPKEARLLLQGRHARLRAVTGPSELAFPDYDGNGMFKSLGNVLVNAEVGLLFIAMHGRPQRLRVNGTATVSRDDPLLASTVGAQLMVRVTARVIFPNCPRYIPDMQLVDPSIYAPRPASSRRSRRGRISTASGTASIRASPPSRADAL